jgi:linoleoyl-CoA desaturase
MATAAKTQEFALPSADNLVAGNAERLRRFGEELDQIRARAEARLGEDDVRYVKRLDRFSRTMEIIGRALIHFSVEPITFAAGVVALWLHKQLQATEIGHSALHGAWDGLPGAERYHSERFRWDLPIDEASWRRGHNIRHHQYTNVAGRDPDIHFGPVRLTEHTPYDPRRHRWQLPFALLLAFPNFGFAMNLHFTGLIDVYAGNGRPEGFDFLEARDRKSVIDAHKRALRKFVPYYLYNFVFWPLLAGPFWWKVLLGNFLAEMLRDVYSAATIYCGHVGPETASYAEGTRARGRGAWYAMQVEATNNFEVRRPISILCGALDLQIEHHLFPRLPPNRLREIAPEVRAACNRHGVTYRSAGWGTTLKRALGHIHALSKDAGGGLRALGAVAREMA